METINLTDLKRACNKFDKFELRGSFYGMTLNLVNKSFETEGFLLMLSTWNRARFNRFTNTFDIDGFKNSVRELNPIFVKLKDQTLKSANFDDIKEDIKIIYNNWSKIKGVEYTGTSKIMHLKNPKLFVMWDTSIRKHYNFNKCTSDEYVEFLKRMQKLSKGIKWNNRSKTLAKAIDEYNYVRITLPALKK